jgi:NAD(P)-dependent dehydrogenase (short-subunit alcohol dehydrogenase family)
VQVTEEKLDTILSINVKSVAFAFKYQLPAIEKSGGKGSMLVTSSVGGARARADPYFKGFGLYAASKAAVNMLTQYAVSTLVYCTVIHTAISVSSADAISDAARATVRS